MIRWSLKTGFTIHLPVVRRLSVAVACDVAAPLTAQHQAQG